MRRAFHFGFASPESANRPPLLQGSAGKRFHNCSFYHINVSNTMVAAVELTSYSTNHIHESFALSMTLFRPHSVITSVFFINEVCMYKVGTKD